MTIATIGHNGGPELDDGRQSVRTRWAKALFADPDTPVYAIAIAWPIHWYSQADGSGAALSNEQLELYCGIAERTVTRGKKWLFENGYVQLKVGKRHEKTRFQLTIPPPRVATQSTQGRHTDYPEEGSHTGEVATQATLEKPRVATQASQGSPIGDRRVDCVAPLFSKDNQERIQEKRALARGRQDERPKNFWQEALNPQSSDVLFERGKLTLLNGARVFWLNKFDSDETRLDLALIQIAPSLQPNSQRSLQVQVEGQLAKLVAQRMDQDRRYTAAAKSKATVAAGGESRLDRISRYVEEAQAEQAPKRGGRS